MNGGKNIKLRKFHFLEGKTYHSKVFLADKPKTGANLAYQFLKEHYKLGSKKFNFTIIDTDINRKYKYSGETLKNGQIKIKTV